MNVKENRVTMGQIYEKARELKLDIIVDPDEPIRPGDRYLAGRNTGVYLLTCLKVDMGSVIPIESAYSYDLHECYKIVDAQ